jgi:hypothetical protein
MKKATLLLISFIMIFGIFAALPAAAGESDLYYVNVPIVKIFPHRLGYYVIYRRSGLQTGECFIPAKWLARSDQRAIYMSVKSNINPYLSIVMKKGEFEHVRIYAPQDLRNQAWGVLDGTRADMEEKFNIEKLDIKF